MGICREMALHRNYTRRGDIVASMDISTEVEYLGKDKNAIYFCQCFFSSRQINNIRTNQANNPFYNNILKKLRVTEITCWD